MLAHARVDDGATDDLKKGLLDKSGEPRVEIEVPVLEKKDPWARGSWRHTCLLGFYFVVWYVMNIYYNVWHKQLLNEVHLPWTIACLQLGVSPMLFLLPYWGLGLRKAPKLTGAEWRAMTPIGAFHMVGHVTTAVSLGYGAVSFTHIIKAGEPVFTCLASALVLKSTFRWQVYFTLFPIIAGISLASLKEFDFSWISFIAAMTSNLARAARAIFTKLKMNKPPGENMTPSNVYAVVTILAFLTAVPVALVFEGHKIVEVYTDAVNSGRVTHWFVWKNLVLSGLMSYQEVTFLVLNEVHPVTQSIGNVFKRVFVIGVSLVVFGNPVTLLGAIGCGITILGTLMYSLAKIYFKDPNAKSSGGGGGDF